MRRRFTPGIVFFILAAGFMVLCTGIGYAEKKGMEGWEKGSPYNKLYDAAEMDSFKVEVTKIIEVVPMKGMSPGIALHVREADKEKIIVHVCPTAYMGPNDIGVKRGDKIKIKGVWAEIDGEDIFMASKIKRGDFFVLKLRLTKDGTPFWTMSPEELAKEKEAVGSQ